MLMATARFPMVTVMKFHALIPLDIEVTTSTAKQVFTISTRDTITPSGEDLSLLTILLILIPKM